MTGVLYTNDSQGNEKRAIKDTGLFKELFDKKEAITNSEQNNILKHIIFF